MTTSRVSSHRPTQRRRPFDNRYFILIAVVVVVVIAGVVYAVRPKPAASVAPPVAGASHAGSLVLNATGSELVSWNKTPTYCTGGIGVANGTVATDSAGNAALTTAGTTGSCVGIISPGTYSSGVIEADVDFPALPGKPGTIANWTSLWLVDQATWPVDGELDAVEASPLTGKNAVSWHSGPSSSSVFVASTDTFHQVKLPASGANLTPGWHVVDVVYTKGYFAVYYDGHLYTSYTSSKITGSALNLIISSTVTPKTSQAWNLIGGPEVNSSSSPATTSVKYVRVWSYK
jgi:hypothetical protein